jgi:hypothetical protein
MMDLKTQGPFFELRFYPVRPGCMEKLVAWMEERVMPFQASKGMVAVASFASLEDEEEYVWIRRFESEAEKIRLYDDVYGSREWVDEIGPVNGTLLYREKIRVVRMKATPRSVIR